MDSEVLFGRVQRFIGSLRHCQHLGIEPVSASHNELVVKLPYSEKIIGDPETRIIHGGAITTLMDTTSGTAIMCALENFELCPTLDLRVDYMRPAQPDQAVLERARTYRITRSIIFTRCEAFQDDDPAKTVAHCVATFMRIGADATPESYRNLILGEQS